MALEKAKRDSEGAGADTKEGPDSEDNLGIGRGTGATGEDQESILAVSEDSDVTKREDGVALEENLETEADSKDLAEIVGAGAKGGANVNTLTSGIAGKENHDA